MLREGLLRRPQHESFDLDSFAFLAYLGGEAGEGRVKEILFEPSRGSNRTLMSLINLGEVVYITERERGLDQHTGTVHWQEKHW
jgi:hypothetical protein